MMGLLSVASPEVEADSVYVAEVEGRIAEMRRIGFAIEDALQKTPKGVSVDRNMALFIRTALFDYADRMELDI